MADTAEKLLPVKIGRYKPTCFGPSSWWRFSKDRRRRYLSLLPAAPDARQSLAIEQLIECEWGARRAEHDAEATTNDRNRYYAQRLAADMRKQVLLWHRELNAAIAAANKAEPTAPPQPNLNDVLADIARRAQSADPEPEDTEDGEAA